MKLGTETGSLVNHMHSMAIIGQPEVYVGMPVTMLSWSDRHPATVIQLFKVGKSIIMRIQADNYQAVPRDNPQYGDHIEYIFTPNTGNCTHTYKKNSKGRWCQVYFNEETKRWVKGGGGGLWLGVREKYHDPHF